MTSVFTKAWWENGTKKTEAIKPKAIRPRGGGRVSSAEMNDLIQWGVARIEEVGVVTVQDIAKRLNSIGFSRDTRTLFRYKKLIDTKFKEQLSTASKKKNTTRTMLSIPELAERWGCSRNFIWQRCKSEEIPSRRIMGDRWFIPMAWVEKQETLT